MPVRFWRQLLVSSAFGGTIFDSNRGGIESIAGLSAHPFRDLSASRFDPISCHRRRSSVGVRSGYRVGCVGRISLSAIVPTLSRTWLPEYPGDEATASIHKDDCITHTGRAITPGMAARESIS